jgi:hypothetical protein
MPPHQGLIACGGSINTRNGKPARPAFLCHCPSANDLRQIELGRIDVSGPFVGLFKLLAADVAIGAVWWFRL